MHLASISTVQELEVVGQRGSEVVMACHDAGQSHH